MPIFSKLTLTETLKLHLAINLGCLAVLLWCLLISDYFFDAHQLSGAWLRIGHKLPQFYNENLRGDFFMAFVSVGAFLLSLKTFIVLTMKKELYDTGEYKKRHEELSALADVGGVYAPLVQLNNYIYWAILVSLVTAVFQVTIGFFSSLFFVVVCISMAMSSCIYLLSSLMLVKGNLDSIICEE